MQLAAKLDEPGEGGSPLQKREFVELVLQANEYAFQLFRQDYLKEISKDPSLMPTVISAVGHDMAYKNHQILPDQFQAGLLHHKIHENIQV